MSRRVVVTGIGLVSSLGIGTEATWDGAPGGHGAASGPITQFDADRASPRGSRARSRGSTRWSSSRRRTSRRWTSSSSTRSRRRSSRWTTPACRSRRRTRPDVGVFIASGIGGFATIEREHSALLDGGPRKISPFFIPSSIINLAAGQVSIRFGAKGPNSATCTACSASAHAIGDAFEIIRRGDADAMIAGGSEAAITPMSVGGFAAMRALSTRNDDPARASRPFDKDRDGFIIGEGAGVLILEELELAKAPRRAHLRRARRLRHVGRRVPHHRAVRGRRRRGPRDDAGAAEGRHRRRPTSTTSTPTAPRRRSTTGSRRWRSSGASASTRAGWRCRRPSR